MVIFFVRGIENLPVIPGHPVFHQPRNGPNRSGGHGFVFDLTPEIRYFGPHGGYMKIKKAIRIPIGFLAAFLFLWRAQPTPRSFVIGALIMALGEAIRFVSAGTLIKFEGVTRTGVYGFTRNPLYIGSFCLGLGACIMGRDLLFAALFVTLFPLLYIRVIRREEAWLVGRYGDDYVAYLREVPRLFPRRFDLGEALRETSPFLAVKNRELRAVLGLAVVLAAMAVKLFALN